MGKTWKFHYNLKAHCFVINLNLKEEKNPGQKAADSKDVRINGIFPPIEKMDASLSTLVNVERLAISTNMIEKIANLNGLSKSSLLETDKSINLIFKNFKREFKTVVNWP